MKCPRCGSDINVGDRTCASCDTPLIWPEGTKLHDPVKKETETEIKLKEMTKSKEQKPEKNKAKKNKLIIWIVIAFVILAALSAFVIFFKDEIFEIIGVETEEKSEAQQTPDDSELDNKNIVESFKGISYEVPANFEEVEQESEDIKYYTYESETENCNLTINKLEVTEESTPEKYLETFTEEYEEDEIGTITKENLNEIEWTKVDITRYNENISAYVIINNGNAYLASIYKQSESDDYCTPSNLSFIESLELE